MKNYINGYDKPQWRIHPSTGADIILNITPKYQFLKEYYQKNSVLQKIIDGSKNKIVNYIDYEWKLSFIDYAEGSNLLIMKKIENYERPKIISGVTVTYQIYLRPHSDKITREFRVFVKDELREIDLHYHFGGADSTANKGYEISFINADSILDVNMLDMNS